MAYVFQRTTKGRTAFTGVFLDPDGVKRSAGTFPTRRQAERAAYREEQASREGRWIDRSRGEIGFRNYVEDVWLPSRHIETSTRAGYVAYLNKQFYPFFGQRPMGKILPSDIQAWVTHAATEGLSASSIRKYHVMLHSVFRRAVRDRVIAFNPCSETELPKVVKKRGRTLTPADYRRVVEKIPEQHRLMIQVAIETGLRWGELIALRPRHVDFLRRTIVVEETIIEVAKKDSPTGERMITKPYPKNDEPRTLGVRPALVEDLSAHIHARGLARDDLLFATNLGTSISRNTFRTRVWLPAVQAAGLDFRLRIHDLRHAHASWLLAGGADLKSVMDRMGHSQIQTTQKYLHTLPEADQRNLDAFSRIADD